MTVNTPLYGVELDRTQLTPDTPSAVLYGVTPNNTFIPIQIDEEGRLKLGSGVTIDTGDITIGEVQITGLDPDNSNSEENLSVTNLGAGNGFSLRSTIYGNNGYPLLVNADGSINVSSTGGSSAPATPTIFNVSLVAANTEYSQALPANTQRFLVKTRSSSATLRLSYQSGGTATNYLTIGRGVAYTEENVKTGVTLYFRADNPTQTIEVVAWS